MAPLRQQKRGGRERHGHDDQDDEREVSGASRHALLVCPETDRHAIAGRRDGIPRGGGILAAMLPDPLKAPGWNGAPAAVGELFRLHRVRCGQPVAAVCQLVTHQLGWELRLEIAGSVQRSEVCRTHDAVLDTSESWKDGMIENGWR